MSNNATPTPEALRPCPWCQAKPNWLRNDAPSRGTGSSGMEAPLRALGCDNPDCEVKPRTKWRDTAEWSPRKGHYAVNYDAQHVAAWNRRTEDGK